MQYDFLSRIIHPGAGDGNVTLQIAPLAHPGDLIATEISAILVRRLEEHGFNVICTDTLECDALQPRALIEMRCRHASLQQLQVNNPLLRPRQWHVEELRRQCFPLLLDAVSTDTLNFPKAGDDNGRFDLICCLNVLDRCGAPLDLLRQIRSLMSDDSRLLLAVVLPFWPVKPRDASQYLEIDGTRVVAIVPTFLIFLLIIKVWSKLCLEQSDVVVCG